MASVKTTDTRVSQTNSAEERRRRADMLARALVIIIEGERYGSSADIQTDWPEVMRHLYERHEEMAREVTTLRSFLRTIEAKIDEIFEKVRT